MSAPATTAASIRSILRKSPKHYDIDDLCKLLLARESESVADVVRFADSLRREQAGYAVSFVVNRNINFTNACVKRCGFCAFSRTPKGSQKRETYLLPLEEIAARAVEARRLGATEICVQAGLPPGAKGDLYIRVAECIKRAVPDVHLHAFSPEEVLYGARLSKVTTSEYLKMLRAAGVDSLPGTAAEILVQEVRDKISPGRITVQEWVRIAKEVHTAAGMRMTSTMMFGHIETPRDIARHLLTIRSLQEETRVFTEFVPLSFVHWEAPMCKKEDSRYLRECRSGPSFHERLLVHAVSRIALGDGIRNIQCSWPKESPKGSVLLLQAGCNDLGGTLMNESISAAAGARHGQLLTPAQMHQIVSEAGPERYLVQRDTMYGIIDPVSNSPLDEFVDEKADSKFGSFHSLLSSDSFRFHRTARSLDAEVR